jgi:PhnB protein
MAKPPKRRARIYGAARAGVKEAPGVLPARIAVSWGPDDRPEERSMSFVPYIMFRGNCAEAMAFYAEVFGADPPVLMRYSEAPEGEGMPPSERVMHAELGLADGKLMASDYPEGMPGDEQKAVSVMHEVADAEKARRVFDRLAEGGVVLMPFGPTFWSQGFGMVRDRFGTHWMIAAAG